MSVSFRVVLLFTRKCTREVQRITGKAAKFEIAHGYTADVFLNRTVLQGETTGLVLRISFHAYSRYMMRIARAPPTPEKFEIARYYVVLGCQEW